MLLWKFENSTGFHITYIDIVIISCVSKSSLKKYKIVPPPYDTGVLLLLVVYTNLPSSINENVQAPFGLLR